MTSIKPLLTAVRDSIPAIPGWQYFEYQADADASPPWIVTSISLMDRITTEAGVPTAGTGRLEVRVTAFSEMSVNVTADLLDMTGRQVHAPGFLIGALVPDIDSGVYSAPLSSDITSQRIPTRVMRYTFTWSRL